MSGVLLAVEWSPGVTDPKPIKWVVSPWLPKLLRTTSVTIGRKTRSRESFELASSGHRRHEARHVQQQAGHFLPWWLLQYVLIKSFRDHMEADAKAHESPDVLYPQFRVVGLLPDGSYL